MSTEFLLRAHSSPLYKRRIFYLLTNLLQLSMPQQTGHNIAHKTGVWGKLQRSCPRCAVTRGKRSGGQERAGPWLGAGRAKPSRGGRAGPRRRDAALSNSKRTSPALSKKMGSSQLKAGVGGSANTLETVRSLLGD